MITLYIYCYVTLNPKSNLNVSVKAQNGFQRSDSTLFFWVLILKKIEPRNEDSLSINFRLLFFYFMSLMCAWDHSLLWALLVSYGHFTIVCHWHIIYHFVLFDPNALWNEYAIVHKHVMSIYYLKLCGLSSICHLSLQQLKFVTFLLTRIIRKTHSNFLFH